MYPLIFAGLVIVFLGYFSQTRKTSKKTVPMPSKIVPLTYRTLFNSYSDIVSKWAMNWNIDPSIIFAVIFQESAGDPTAIGSIGERGLMQLTQGALTDYNSMAGGNYTINELFDIDINIEVGSWYIKFLNQYWNGDLKLAIQSYNGGMGNVKKDNNHAIKYWLSVLIHREQFQTLMAMKG